MPWFRHLKYGKPNVPPPHPLPDSDQGHVELRTPKGSAFVSSACVTDRLCWPLRLSSALGLPALSQAPVASCAPGVLSLEPRGQGLVGGWYHPQASTVHI